jgi:hypothetical protein
MRISLLKQDTYPDLYVCGPEERDPLAILRSTIMRTGPMGLFELADTRFHLIRHEHEPECSAAYRQGNLTPEIGRIMRDVGARGLPGQTFLDPGSDRPQGDLATPADSIDWSTYDIVISINVCLPTRVLARHPRTLFCYMMSEAKKRYSRWAFWGYDHCLTQNTRGFTHPDIGGAIDFPYTFVGPDTLHRIMARHLGRPARKTGVYAEINMSPERPVAGPPQVLAPLVARGYPVRWHRQNILENLEQIYDSRYFVKLGGRCVRGNAIAEAISCGTLVLANPALLLQRELVPESAHVRDFTELAAKLAQLDADDTLYELELARQRERLQHYGVDCPLLSLRRALDRKRRLRQTRVGRLLYRAGRRLAPTLYYLRKHKLLPCASTTC